MAKIRVGGLRFFKTMNWGGVLKEKKFKLELFTFEVYPKARYVCVIILNFEFEIDW